MTNMNFNSYASLAIFLYATRMLAVFDFHYRTYPCEMAFGIPRNS